MTISKILRFPSHHLHIPKVSLHIDLTHPLSLFLYLSFNNSRQGRMKWKKLSSKPIWRHFQLSSLCTFSIFKTFQWQHDCEYIDVVVGKILLVFMERVKNCDRCHVPFQKKELDRKYILTDSPFFRVVCTFVSNVISFNVC